MCRMNNLIVWDIETVPDLKGFAAANGHAGKSDDEVRAELGDKFPKHIYHSIICIGALIGHREDGGRWVVDALGAPHIGERSEKDLIASFVGRIAALSPQLVTSNGSSFDLPVLRYRAMVHGVAAPGLASRPYFNRYTEDAVDLCDVLSSFSSQDKVSLHELCRVMGCRANPMGSAAQRSRSITTTDTFGEAGYPMPNFR
jgi:3'-5' exonuclease